jgi:hypothetical protein
VARIGRESGTSLQLTPEIQEKICTAISKGTPQQDAALSAGISPRTLRYWKRQGKRENGEMYIAFFAAIKKAEAECVVLNVQIIHKAATGYDVEITKTTTDDKGTKIETTERHDFDWCAAAWMLERRYPEQFALKHKKEIEAAVEAAIEKRVKDGVLKSNDRPIGQAKTEEADSRVTVIDDK